MIRVNEEQYWLYAAVDPEIPQFATFGCFRRIRIQIGEVFLVELLDKHDVAHAVFLIDDAHDLEGALRRTGLAYRVEIDGRRTRIERVFREIKHWTSLFSNCFNQARPSTANAWLQAFAVGWNQC